jgi:hypothetical protein
MKTFKIMLLAIFPLLIVTCSEDKMDEINKERNNALEMSTRSMLPDVILKSAFEATGTDLAWYASVYIEHSAGTWAQSADQDRRAGQTDGTLMNNLWNGIYDNLNTLKDILEKTESDGSEPDAMFERGIAQILTAYNLALITDMWGECPWAEALQGAEILQPKYDKQSVIYPQIQQYLSDAITILSGVTSVNVAEDYIYGGDAEAWIKAAYSLKARYAMRLTNVDTDAATDALTFLADGFEEGENFLFDAYEATASGENPWYQFYFDRSHLSISQTLFNLMQDRNDTIRMAAWFELILIDGDSIYNPAPSGEANETQGGVYSTSLITANGRTTPTPMMTYHEVKFIEAEALFRTGGAGWQTALGEAIVAAFEYHGLDPVDATNYFTNDVTPLLTAGNELKEILTQKYIAMFEHEAMEAYNDYRRVPSFLTLNNPNNATTGFVWRYPYPTSEESSNSANIPEINIFSDKTWWAGGTEKVQ